VASQRSFGASIAGAGAVFLAGAIVVWIFDPDIGFPADAYGVVALLLIMSGISMFFGGLWITTLPPSMT